MGNVIVWTVGDIFGFSIVVTIVAIAALAFLIGWIKNKFEK